MFYKLFNVMLVTVTIAVLAACGAAGSDTVKVGAQEAGSTVHVKQGGTLEVTLTGNPTTGYTWEVGPGSGNLVVLQGEPEFKADSSALGSGGTMTLRFKAVSKGTAPLKLIYHRTFEPNVAPLETFEIAVVVD